MDRCFSTSVNRGPHSSFIYLSGPPHFIDATYKKQLPYFHIVDLHIRIYIYSSIIYNYVLFLSILFKYNTLFTYTSKNILLTTGIIFCVFVRLAENLQLFLDLLL